MSGMNSTPTTALSPLKMKLRLVQSQLEQAYGRAETSHANVLEFIAFHRRVDETQPVPRPFRHIAIELSEVTGVDVTHEAVRRWFRASEREIAELLASTEAAAA